MEEKRLPQNAKEGLLYGGIICIITVIVMLFLNIGTVMGINKESLKAILIMIPIIWVVAILLETLVVGRIAGKLVEKFTEPTDGFNTRILFNILFCVTGMSCIMTIVGGMIGAGRFTLEPFCTFLTHWPRNFCVAFWCEILLAQPTARFVMKLIHKKNKEEN